MLGFVNRGQNIPFPDSNEVLHTKVCLIFTRGRNCWLDSIHFKAWEVVCHGSVGSSIPDTTLILGTDGRLKNLV